MKHALSGIVLLLYFMPTVSFSQDNSAVASPDKITHFPSNFLNTINSRTSDLDKLLTNQTERYLARMSKQEERLKKKLSRFDTTATKNIFSSDIRQQYIAKLQRLKSDTGVAVGRRTPTGDYFSYVDSLHTSLLFLKKYPGLLDGSKDKAADIQSSLNKLQGVQAKLQNADQLSQFMQQRQQQIRTSLSRYTHLPAGITNVFNGYKKQMAYYGQQVQQYKEILNDPDKMMKTALQYLNKVPAFTSFMSKNSLLASLFNLPGGSSTAGSTAVGQGMPFRDQVLAVFQLLP